MKRIYAVLFCILALVLAFSYVMHNNDGRVGKNRTIVAEDALNVMTKQEAKEMSCRGVDITKDMIMGKWTYSGGASAAPGTIVLKANKQFTLTGLRPNNYNVGGSWDYLDETDSIVFKFTEDAEYWTRWIESNVDRKGEFDWEEGFEDGIPYIKVIVIKDLFSTTEDSCGLSFNFQGHTFNMWIK